MHHHTAATPSPAAWARTTCTRGPAGLATKYLRVHQRWPRPRVLLCTPVGELDLFTAPLLRRALTVAHHQRAAVVADLTRLRFMAAAGAAVLLQAAGHAKADERTMAVVPGTGLARRVLELTGAADLLTVYPAVAEAIRAAEPGPLGQGGRNPS